MTMRAEACTTAPRTPTLTGRQALLREVRIRVRLAAVSHSVVHYSSPATRETCE